MYNKRIILHNYSKGSFGNIFTDSQFNVYKITKISENGLLTSSNINEVIFFNLLNKIKNTCLNEPTEKENSEQIAITTDINLNTTNDNDQLIKVEKISYKSLVEEKLFIQSVSTKHYDCDNIKKNYVFSDTSISIKYTNYLSNRVDKLLLVNVLPKYHYNLSKFIEKYHIYVINNFDRIAKKLLRSLALLHHNGFLHGDLKSTNILINDLDNLCLTDFGAIKMANFDKYHLSCTATSRCPEDLDYEYTKVKMYSNSNFKSDIWSFGLILTEMILGFNPILKLYERLKKIEGSYVALENKMLGYYKTIDYINVLELAKINSIKTHYDDKLYKKIEVIEQMLKVNPEERLSSIEEVYEKLFEEKFEYNFKINYTYDYEKFNKEDKFNMLFDIRKKYYKNALKACVSLNIIFTIPFIIDVLDRFFIKLLDKIIKNTIDIREPDINIIFCCVIILVSGIMNQIQVTYKDVMYLFNLTNDYTNIGILNNNLLEILKLMEYDIVRPFNIFYCKYLVENVICNCSKPINQNKESWIIHCEGDNNKLLSILNEIINKNIIGVSPEYYYEKLIKEDTTQ